MNWLKVVPLGALASAKTAYLDLVDAYGWSEPTRYHKRTLVILDVSVNFAVTVTEVARQSEMTSTLPDVEISLITGQI